jgi:hypothetical protein
MRKSDEGTQNRIVLVILKPQPLCPIVTDREIGVL